MKNEPLLAESAHRTEARQIRKDNRPIAERTRISKLLQEPVINLQAAKQIGLTIPPDVLARADKVIQ